LVDLNNQFYPGQRLSMAIGIASCDSPGQVETTLNEADQAMFAAKDRFYGENKLDRRRT
jgi:GGDEF domain-containing protein